MPYKLFGVSDLRHPPGQPNFQCMQLSVPTETAAREKRVAIAPDSIGRFKKLGFDVVVQKGAGLAAGFRDDAYTAAGARLERDRRSPAPPSSPRCNRPPPMRSR